MRRFVRGRVRWSYCMGLAIPLLLVAILALLPGARIQARSFLARYAPAALRFRCGLVAPLSSIPARDLGKQRPVFAGLIAPMLRERCSGCHGPEKQRASLRLDTLADLLKGGVDGPVVKAGEGDKSLLVQRLAQPLDEDGHMPPEGSPQPTAREIALLRWWIDAGMPTAQPIGDLKLGPELQALLEESREVAPR